MHKTIWAAAIALLCFPALLSAQTTERLDIKLGLWKTTTVTESSGQPPIPQEVLDRLTPEQKAKMEERMKAASGAKTVIRHHCLTQEDLDKMTFARPDNKSCTTSNLKSTSSVQDANINCGQGAMKTSGTVHVEALDRGNVKGSFKMTMTDGTHTMNMNSQFTGTWEAPTCTAADNR